MRERERIRETDRKTIRQTNMFVGKKERVRGTRRDRREIGKERDMEEGKRGRKKGRDCSIATQTSTKITQMRTKRSGAFL